MTTILMVVAMVAGSASVQMDRQSAQATGFEARHSEHNISAKTQGLTGSAEVLSDGRLQAQLSARIDSLHFGDACSDKYVREALNAKKYPFIKVSVVAPAGSTDTLASGTVTMRGVTRPIQILLHVSGATVSGEIPLDLKNFGVPALTLLSFPIDSTVQMHFDLKAPQEMTIGETRTVADAR